MREKVIIIYEDFWDQFVTLGIAKDYKSAIDFLVKTNQLIPTTEIYYNGDKIPLNDERFVDFETVFHEILKMTIKEFNEFFEGVFSLDEIEVYQTKE